MAGVTVGIVAVPLAMALAIATGVPPQHGLYTAIVAGAIIALTGGSRVNVSGPTAAFVVILFPIVQQYGLGGLLIATMMAGLILVVMGITRLGTLIEFVPYPVVLGFTAGIAVVIATLQIPDLLGLEVEGLGPHFIDNIVAIGTGLSTINALELGVGSLTLAVLIFWPRLRLPGPAPLTGLAVGTLAAYVINQWPGGLGHEVATIASRFTWEIAGTSGSGIPSAMPVFTLPWHLPISGAESGTINFELIRNLTGPAFAIAVLAAIESLLCAVVADGMTHTRHDPNAELIGQGLGNLVAPLFGGITATAAIARTATSIRSGAVSPIAATVHALVVLITVMTLAGLLSLVPMAALAALLVVVAWNMSEARHFVHTLRSAPAGDVAVLLVCFALTVIFDMVLAVGVGIGLAGALFIRRMADITQSEKVDSISGESGTLPREVAIYDINGPLFFGVADKAVSSMRLVDSHVRVIIIDMKDVPSIDATAIVALKALIDAMRVQHVGVIFVGLSTRQIVKLRRSGIRKVRGQLSYCSDPARATTVALEWLTPESSGTQVSSHSS